jgi:hypothetical protein
MYNVEEKHKVKPIRKWSKKEKKIALKNQLREKTCVSCTHQYCCSLWEKNKYNSCYEYKEFVIKLATHRFFANTRANEILKEYPLRKQEDTIFYLKPVYSKTNIFIKIKDFLKKLFRR